jgi:flavin reductase (DIM6/NTAB) family NADH-FMN oxidoreductase RutF
MADVDAAQFRHLCGRFATGVVVITARAPDGSPAGMTANSFTSVSLEPPLVSVNVEHVADFHAVVTTAERFVINILATDQEALSRRFAGPTQQRFDGIGFRESDLGQIVLDGVIAAIECVRVALFEAGDHTIVVGRVQGGMVREGRPLLYFRGGYHTLS